MLRRAVAAGLTILGTSQIRYPADADAHRPPSCGGACLLAKAEMGPAQDALSAGVAHIAVRATSADGEAAPLTQQDWLSLYLLLSLQDKGTHS